MADISKIQIGNTAYNIKDSGVRELIPAQASSENQLADKAFVNSSIQTNTATFCGTYNLVSDLSLTTAATQQEIAAAIATKLSTLSITADNNDYVFVQIPTADATPTEIARVDRYKYDGSAWGYEWSLNNSSFTAAQWAALNSGITSALVGKLGDLPTNSELNTALAGKQNVIDANNKLDYSLLSNTPTVPTISTDIEADKASNDKTASPKSVFDAMSIDEEVTAAALNQMQKAVEHAADGALTGDDVKNNLMTTASRKPLSATQGKVLKDLSDENEQILGAALNSLYALSALASAIAPLYSGARTYAVGDVVMHGNMLYKCNTAISTPEPFTESKWDVADEYTVLSTLVAAKEALTNKVTSLSSSSTDTQYPSAKAVYDHVPNAAVNAKTETKSDQEIVFRKTNVSWPAKAEVVKKLKGKTLVWNQLVKNGDFANASGISAHNDASFSVSGNVATVVVGSSASQLTNSGISVHGDGIITGHKYYISVFCKSATDLGLSVLNGLSGGHFSWDAGYGNETSIPGDSVWHRVEKIGTATQTQDLGWVAGAFPPDVVTYYLRDFMVVDLTLLFGAGNEPTTVAAFEAIFPESYYPYNAGTLISNDAEGLETVGFNLWDEEWEVGNLDGSGLPITSDNSIRSINFCRMLPNADYYLQRPSGDNSTTVYIYDANHNFIEYHYTSTFTSSQNAAYFKLARYNAGATYNHDICINLSDPNRNDTYEPYRKSTMPLNLNAIKVYSHNIWDEEWELGSIDENGGFVPSDGSIRAKNYYKVFGGATYCFTGSNAVIYCYDANKTFIPYTGQTGSPVWKGGMDITNTTFIPPLGTSYIRFCMSGAYGTTYNHDICINLSSSFNGQYEPGGILTIEGLKGAGSVYDEIVGNKLVKRVGRMDMGAVYAWYRSTGNVNPILYMELVSGVNSTCAKYVSTNVTETAFGFSNKTDKLLGMSGSQLFVRDDAYTDPAVFKTAMNGVYLDYELATPVEYTLVEPLPSMVSIDQLGTERAVPPVHADGSPSAPLCADIQYGATSGDFADTVATLSKVLPEIQESIHPSVATSQPSGGFVQNVVYELGTVTGTVTFALASALSGKVNHYYWTFDTSSTAPTITWPAGISWIGGSAPTINASKHYEISIMDGVGVYMEV